jgi:predicted amidohydrolase YtcJ
MLIRGRIARWLIAVCVIGGASSEAVGRRAADADLVVVGDIHTMDEARSQAGGMAIKDGRIIYVGKGSEARERLRRGGRLVEVRRGDVVLPSFVDSHVHMLEAGVLSLRCLLGDADVKTKQTMLAAIAKYAAAHPELEWVIGSGWLPTLFEDGVPKKSDLDAVIPDRPAVFYGADGHSAWLNSAALAAADITEKTEDPDGGRIVRDASNAPSGTLLESAVDLVEKVVPKPSRETSLAGLDYAQKLLHSLGITMVQDANVNPGNLAIYHDAATSGLLTMKVVAAQETYPGKAATQVDDLVRLRDRFSYGRLSASSAKIFVDGVLEYQTAALVKPYEGGGNERGTLRWDQAVLTDLAKRLDRAGFQLHMHVIGDQAARSALDALAAARAANGPSDNRHQLVHLQLVDPVDIPRLARLGVVANFETFWFFADEWINENMAPLIGADRASRVYPFRSVAKTGAVIVAGSDWPVSTPNPFLAIQVGVTRQSPTDPRDAPWVQRERASLETLVTAYTIAGAYVNHRDNETGSLEVGKAADFIVIDRDLFKIRPQEIGKTRVLLTFVDGRQVYEALPPGP